MDEPKDDKAKKRKDRTSDDGPSYMQPREPVLEEPLMGGEREAEESDESMEDGTPNDKNQAARESLSMDIEGEDAKQTERVEVPTSPYFPHGVYEDAQVVEEYYAHEEAEETQ
jgi:hypothetical protein